VRLGAGRFAIEMKSLRPRETGIFRAGPERLIPDFCPQSLSKHFVEVPLEMPISTKFSDKGCQQKLCDMALWDKPYL